MDLWHMSSHPSYMKKAADCLRAADMVHDSAERAALTKVAACFALLADYVGTRQNQGTAHREDRAGLQTDRVGSPPTF